MVEKMVISPCFMFKLRPSVTRILNLAKRMGKMCALIWDITHVSVVKID